LWERDEMRREGACEVEGKRDATWEASRQPSVVMSTRRAAVFAAMRPFLSFIILLIAEFYLVDRGLRHRLPGFSSLGRLVILP
jgi:hypothetical protein